MARLKKKDMILSLAQKHNMGPGSMKLLESILHDSIDGFLHDCESKEALYVNQIFHGDEQAYKDAYYGLQKNGKFIIRNQSENFIYIKPYDQIYYDNLLIEYKNKKRRYRMDMERDRRSFYTTLDNGKYSRLLSVPNQSGGSKDFIYDTRPSVVKITQPFMPYFTGTPLTEEETRQLQKNPHNKPIYRCSEINSTFFLRSFSLGLRYFRVVSKLSCPAR